ncbi:TetR family transcriptional regulator [Bordetella pertussis]|nr:TetR family transcriptional regulator [Bordetella pertussis]
MSDRYEDMWQDAVDDALRAGLVDGDARVMAPGDFIEAMLRAALPGLPPGTGAWPLRD